MRGGSMVDKTSKGYKDLLLFLEELGIEKKHIDSLLENFYEYHHYSPETLYKKALKTTKCLLNYGFDSEEVKRVVSNSLPLFTYNIEHFEDRLNALKMMGYSKDNIIDMVINAPTILGCDIEKIKDRFNHIKDYGLTDEETIKITSKIPRVLVSSTNYIDIRRDYFLEMAEKSPFKRQFPSLINWL